MNHATEIEFLSVFEVWDHHVNMSAEELPEEISDGDAREVHDLASSAVVTVTFPDLATRN